MQRPAASSGFEQQLEAYSATSKSIMSASNWREGLGSWPIYAAAAASALACSTSASASIIYSSAVNLSAAVAAAATSSRATQTLRPLLAARLTVSHSMSDGALHERARLTDYGGGHPFILAAGGLAKLFASGAVISGPEVIWEQGAALWEDTNGVQKGHWGTDGQPGFAAFRIQTSPGNYDYGWLQLSVTGNAEGPDSITLIDYAYNDVANASIEAGETPEPSTKALMLLAAGFAGVLAWRRRKAAV